jgi:hypothetical protein
MLQVFHGRQGPSKPKEGKADRDKGHMVRPWRRQKRCVDILGKGGEDRVWRHDTYGISHHLCLSRLLPLTGTGTLSTKRNLHSPVTVSGKRDIRWGWGREAVVR